MHLLSEVASVGAFLRCRAPPLDQLISFCAAAVDSSPSPLLRAAASDLAASTSFSPSSSPSSSSSSSNSARLIEARNPIFFSSASAESYEVGAFDSAGRANAAAILERSPLSVRLLLRCVRSIAVLNFTATCSKSAFRPRISSVRSWSVRFSTYTGLTSSSSSQIWRRSVSAPSRDGSGTNRKWMWTCPLLLLKSMLVRFSNCDLSTARRKWRQPMYRSDSFSKTTVLFSKSQIFDAWDTDSEWYRYFARSSSSCKLGMRGRRLR
mmetsp:Transcript_16556/g.62958  ORF Transcript_16556/g.62958 Transcript_16556/m.62958 type:complete len:265 (+) Transcript_16556:27-821(+)|eukprot:scaffold1330_cov240-Pinguiococcus_pyrenoidosus.AAC.15